MRESKILKFVVGNPEKDVRFEVLMMVSMKSIFL
jgi:hypothetical protein